MTAIERQHRTKRRRELISMLGMVAGFAVMAIASTGVGTVVGFAVLAAGLLLA
jgi:hypothetical protein